MTATLDARTTRKHTNPSGSMNSDPDRGILRAPGLAAICRRHPLMAWVAAVLVMAAAGAAGYATRPAPETATTTGAPVVKPVLAGSDAPVRGTVVWRDETGAIYRAKIGDGRFDELLRRREATLEAARSFSRDWAAAEILAELKPVFPICGGACRVMPTGTSVT